MKILPDSIKKYRYIVRDTRNRITYFIYSSKELTKKEKIRHIHCHLHQNGYELPEEGAIVNVICGEM